MRISHLGVMGWAIFSIAPMSCDSSSESIVGSGAHVDARSSKLRIKVIYDKFDLLSNALPGEDAEARATVGIFNNTVAVDTGMVSLPDTKLGASIHSAYCDGLELCKELHDALAEAKLFDRPWGARCSGVLVSEDLVVTAKHCEVVGPWDRLAFVFGYEQNVTSVTAEHCYRGELIDSNDQEDWVLIKLDRHVPAHVATPVRLGTAVLDHGRTPVHSYGHPLGLPRQRSGEDGSVVFQCENQKMDTTLDRFQYGSGSPVYENKTGNMIGLLRGAINDFDSAQSDSGDHCCIMVHDHFDYSFPPPACAGTFISATAFLDEVEAHKSALSQHSTAPRPCP
jgi:hypothetical protein